ncbi:MAG TPA: efflux RND transporter periplasmic adaptor subunit [Bryobacteraceae bacterium]|nr:efflux RND transporter periplasmic adaptor subunit [Bryobacteraceae bacterium]
MRLLAAFFCAVGLFSITGCGHGSVKTNAGEHAQGGPDGSSPAVTSSTTNDEITLSPAAVQAGGIRVEAVMPVSIATEVKATGQVVPNEDLTYRVGAHVSGRIGSIDVKLGDHVTQGQILLRVHSHEIHDTRAAYLVARDSVRQAQERSAYAQRVRDRAQRLLALQAISREQADQAETEWNTSLAAVDAAKSQMVLFTIGPGQ